MREFLKIGGICLLISILILCGLYWFNKTFQTEEPNHIDFFYLEDKTGQLKIKDIDQQFLHGNFLKSNSADFHFGRSNSAFWIRISAKRSVDLKNYLAIYCPNIQYVQLYEPVAGYYNLQYSGWGNSSIQNDEGLTYPVFRIDQGISNDRAIYLRIQSDYSHLYTIGFYNQKELNHARVIDYCLNSFLFGILLAIALINIICYFILHNKVCIVFSLCVLLVSAQQGCTTGIYNVILGKNSKVIMNLSIEIGLMYLISIILFFLVFSRIHHPVYTLLLKILIGACLLGYPLCFIDKIIANLYAHVLVVVPAIIVSLISLRFYFTGQMKHNLFLIGWNITTIMYIFVALGAEGILHVENNYITIHMSLVVIVVVSVIFMIAIVKNIKNMQMEHLKTQQRLTVASERVKSTEIALMQTQIKPHFLYNTLTAIEQLCEIDSKKAQVAITEFAAYLRSNIDFSVETKLIRFEVELENVKHYLALEKMRFDERLTVIYDIKANGFMLPPLVVQPMVENAVRHGITKKTGGGRISIVVAEAGTYYMITIADNGVGFEIERAMRKEGNHVGISNVRDRLARQCHGSLKIDSQIGRGTTVRIIIPKELRNEPDCS